MAELPDNRPQWRLECLRLAVTAPGAADAIVPLAARMFEFLMHGHSEGLPPTSGQVGQIFETLHKLEAQGTTIMATLDELQAKADSTLAKVTALADPLVSIKAALDAKDATIADLKTQLDAAIAAGGDPTKFQALSDTMDKILAASDNQALAEGALANTPAAPATPAP